MRDMEENDSTWEDVKTMALDQTFWRSLVVYAPLGARGSKSK